MVQKIRVVLIQDKKMVYVVRIMRMVSEARKSN
jgi:hypothetical protein